VCLFALLLLLLPPLLLLLLLLLLVLLPLLLLLSHLDVVAVLVLEGGHLAAHPLAALIDVHLVAAA
jgi:hypothetical protein